MIEYPVTKVEARPLLDSAGPFTSFVLLYSQNIPTNMTTMEITRLNMTKAWGVGGVEMCMVKMGP